MGCGTRKKRGGRKKRWMKGRRKERREGSREGKKEGKARISCL